MRQQIVDTTLETEGRPSLQPFPTSFVASQVLLTTHVSQSSLPSTSRPWGSGPVPHSSLNSSSKARRSGVPTSHSSLNSTSRPSGTVVLPTRTANRTMPSWLPSGESGPDLHRRGATDCFQPVATSSIPHQISSRGDHPVPRLGIVRYKPVIRLNFQVTDQKASRLRKPIQCLPINSMLIYFLARKVKEYGHIHIL